MNAYDFDNTIYDGDSTVDFFLYSFKHYPKTLLHIPEIGWASLCYLLKISNKTKMKEKFYKIFREIPDIQKFVTAFWDEHFCHIKDWYYKIQQPDDLIISASPSFLLKPVCEKLGIKNLIASEVNCFTGNYNSPNCHGKEKVKRFYKEYPTGVIERFYSDSYSDDPMAQLANASFLVKGNKITPWKSR